MVMNGDISEYQKALTSHMHANIKPYHLFTSGITHCFHILPCHVSYSSLHSVLMGQFRFVPYSCLPVISAQYFNQSSGFKYYMCE